VKAPPTAIELFNLYNSGVVLIKHEYFYRAVFDNGLSLYYSGHGESFQVYIDVEEAIANPSISYATGFFVDSTGTLATNMHVISPQHDASRWMELNKQLYSIKEDAMKRIKYLRETHHLAMYYLDNYQINYSDRLLLTNSLKELQDSINTYEGIATLLEFNSYSTSRTLMTVNISIAYNNSRAEQPSDFDKCIFITKGDDINRDEDIDLGLIQLENKRSPAHVQIFDIQNYPDSPLNINDVVYMIGYNYGFDLANTSTGLKSQLMQGYITQEPDVDRVLYSIPTLLGSSGSPVIDQWGNLVAINYAKLEGEQGFNFGIPVKHLKRLYERVKQRIYNHHKYEIPEG